MARTKGPGSKVATKVNEDQEEVLDNKEENVEEQNEEVINQEEEVEEEAEQVKDEEEEVVEEIKPKESEKPAAKVKPEKPAAKVVDFDSVQEDPRIWYQKVGGGSLRIGNKIIKPGEKVQLDPTVIKPAWKDLLKPLQDVPVKKETPIVVDITKSVYSLKQRDVAGLWWDVVDAQGKVVNDKALRKEKAEEYIKDMMR